MISIISISAQNDGDALRFSQYIYGGTARSISMGGAFGALGGDFGSLSINPAGIGVYRAGEFTITPNMNYYNSASNYLDYKHTEYNEKFLLGNLGYVNTFNTKKTDGWISASIGLGYNRLNDFNNFTNISAINKSSSLLDNFVQNANGNSPDYLDPFYEKLAYDAKLIYNPTSDLTYYANDLNVGGYHELQEQKITTSGGIGEYLISFGANYNNKLYIGASLGIQQASYNIVKSLSETDVNGNIPYLNSFTFDENYNVHGTGYAFKVGAIYKPIEMLRLGLAVHFPTYYNLHSESQTNMSAKYDSVYSATPQTSSGVNDFSMMTPWRMIGSVGLQFGNIGLLSMDIERVDYSTMHFSSASESDLNDSIQKYYKPSLNIRLGGEIKISSFALRAGYALYGSPYVKGYGNDNVNTSIISAGIGFRRAKFFCDLGYTMSTQKMNYVLYEAGGFANQAALTNKTSQFMATIGFRF